MPKPRVEKIEVGYIGGDYQEVFINGNSHWFNIHWSDVTILQELEQYYDFDDLDRKELEVMW